MEAVRISQPEPVNSSFGVITHSTQDHGQDLIAGDVLVGTKGGGGEALDQLCVAAVVDIAGEPVVRLHIIELVLVSIDGESACR